MPRACDGLILGVIFAGGASRRYGSDKALALLDGVSLLERVIARAGPQVDALSISGLSRPGFQLPIIADAVPNAGPLSALCSALAWADQGRFPLLATFSCDAPFIPADLVRILWEALQSHDCAVVVRSGNMHPTFAVWKTSAYEKVLRVFATGVRSLCGAIADVDSIVVDFSAVWGGPGGDPFFNINCPRDMAMAQAALAD